MRPMFYAVVVLANVAAAPPQALREDVVATMDVRYGQPQRIEFERPSDGCRFVGQTTFSQPSNEWRMAITGEICRDVASTALGLIEPAIIRSPMGEGSLVLKAGDPASMVWLTK